MQKRILGQEKTLEKQGLKLSARRDSNPRPSPWQGDAPPLSHSRISFNFVEQKEVYNIFIIFSRGKLIIMLTFSPFITILFYKKHGAIYL